MRKSWTSPVSIQDRNREIKRGNYVDLPLIGVKVAYMWGLASSQGAWFVLIKDASVTHRQLQLAKNKLKFERDVVDLSYAEIEQCPNCMISDEYHPFQLVEGDGHAVKCVVCDYEWESFNYRTQENI